MLILSITGDGACLYRAVSAFLYEDESQAPHLRRMAHQFICMNWWYFKHFVIFPFIETVGVGKASFKVHFENEDELLEFLQTDDSLLMWSSHTDIAVLANMCNLNIHTFTYFSGTKPPVWSTTSPDPYLTHYTSFDVTPVRDVVLYNSNNVHYELLVTPDSRLALQGYVPDRLPSLVAEVPEDNSDVVEPEDPIDVELEELIDVEEEDLVASPSLRQTQLKDVQTFFSPLNFIPCPRGPGRPKNTRQGAASLKRKQQEPMESEGQAPKKRRGRPPGSKNKKNAETIRESQNTREQAENSADPEDSIPFFDSGDLCNICQFAFNNPIKKLKKIVKCPRCDQFVHEPCLAKTVCSCIGSYY